MSKYRIHRVTEKDKAFNDLLDEVGYDYEDQAVYCLTDKKGKLYSNGGAAPVYISSYNKDVKGIPSEAISHLKDIIADGYQINPKYLFPGNRIKIIMEASKEIIEEIEKYLLDTYGKSLTKQEVYMVKSFIRKINAPSRNPNFDNGVYNADISGFYDYMERHKEYLKRELAPTIEMFNTPDKEDKTPENALDVTDDLKIQEENENLDLPELY